ncbi:MAG: hypothetical protein K6B68_14800 [Eubacterium sp.]|nr:hypothetical protein [Eubacterium sp.]
MKKGIALILVAGLLFTASPLLVYAAPEEGSAVEATSDNDGSLSEENLPAESEESLQGASTGAQDNIVTTKHTAVINGKNLSYTADTGTMVVETCGTECEFFYTAYTLDGVEDKSERPISFAFNGGPGSASVGLHLICLGPKRVELDDVGNAVSLPSKIVDNDNSILEFTDLVFIDPVGTGYSRALDPAMEETFYDSDNDVYSVGDFIRLYLNRYKRWGSEKYIIGESYGTIRAVGVCEYLSGKYMTDINGLILIGSVNDYSSVLYTSGNDLPYALFLPTMAADAWYHKAISKEYLDMELKDYLDEVRDFVSSEYVSALFMGNRLTKQEKEELAKKISGYIGLPEDYVLESDLRITNDDFFSELFKDQKKVIGRMDGRIVGYGEGDPSLTDYSILVGNSIVKYITEELGFETDRPYNILSDEVLSQWKFGVHDIMDQGYVSQEADIEYILSHNRFLRVWVISGYYDGATPFYGQEWIFSHAYGDDFQNSPIFTYYPAGHMFYTDKESFDAFRDDAEKWFTNDK